MRYILTFILWCIVLINIFSQTTPYALSPKWMFGKRAGLDFTSGSPVYLGGNPASLNGQEATTTICDPTKNIALYCNNSQIYNITNTLFMNVNGGNGHSSTNGSIAIPDPNSPSNQFYVFTGNDLTGGNSGGINWYLIRNTAGTLSLISNSPSSIINNSLINESLHAGSDGNGGYWVVSRGRNRNFYSWHITTAGVSATVVSTATGANDYGASSTYGTVKINQCQNRIASIGSYGYVEVYNWDRTTGRVVSLIRSVGAYLGDYLWGYGCEFSPDGNMLYFTSLSNNKLWQLNISSGVVTYLGNSSNDINEMGTLQLAPDNKIYVTNVSNSTPSWIGVVDSPNSSGTACSYNNNGYKLTTNTYYRGIANIAYTNPNIPLITSSTATECFKYNFSYTFRNYFTDNISVVHNSEIWDFGDGTGAHTGLGATPSYTYNTSGNYTVKLTFRDVVCNESWTTTYPITVVCTTTPITLVEFSGTKLENKIHLFWTTSSEKDNKKFIIEKSIDGANFYQINEVKGNGTTTMYYSYSCDDLSPANGVNYYRLIDIDTDGNMNYSNVIGIDFNSREWHIYPNPFGNTFIVNFPNPKIEHNIDIFSVNGQYICSYNTKSNFIVLGNVLEPGAYILTIRNEQETVNIRIIKK